MSLFNQFFGNQDDKDTNERSIRWSPLTDLKQLEGLISDSFEKPVFIFKHSTRCSISRMALKQFERAYSIDEDHADAYFLDLLDYRQISNEIASNFQIRHESPQLLLIRNGKCIYDASHSDIDALQLKEKI